MKNTIFLFLAAFVFNMSVNAQSTVDSIKAKYQLKPMPEALTIEKSFPVIGTYQLTNADGSAQTVTITLDQDNKGMVWIEGLPQGKMKAYLKKSPGTYRILSQKSESGQQIPEGTLVFDPMSNQLNIALGKKFDDADPSSVFTVNSAQNTDVATNGTNQVKVKTKKGNTKEKQKIIFYTAAKSGASTTTMNGTQQQ